MNKIEFREVCPEIFAHSSPGAHGSDIWRKPIVSFLRGKKYLIECASGTGKSSLCSYIIGMRRDFRGHILFDGRDSASYSIPDWVRLRTCHISLMFQELRMFPELTALENVEIRNSLTNALSRATVAEWFERLGLADKLRSPLGMMSFGQQQRVAVIRALAGDFQFLFLDEPTSHLDDANSAVVAALVEEEARKRNAAVIVTSIGRHPNLNYDYTYAL